ncbi:MAG: hypothetical protein GKC03_03605 [Methanomassiliicoccales archaeon]|nr:hypothetical protein [Methanomassiliicoccales archaeon]NYT15189.1 hypothetical protein [Methanomassiliicoccales archaeon]
MEESIGTKRIDFVTISADKISFGRNNFIEVARKRAVTDDGENEFISISRGYYLPDGTERFKKSLTIPDEAEVKEFVISRITDL